MQNEKVPSAQIVQAETITNRGQIYIGGHIKEKEQEMKLIKKITAIMFAFMMVVSMGCNVKRTRNRKNYN